MGPSKWVLADTDGYYFIFLGDFITLYPMELRAIDAAMLVIETGLSGVGILVRGQPC